MDNVDYQILENCMHLMNSDTNLGDRLLYPLNCNIHEAFLISRIVQKGNFETFNKFPDILFKQFDILST